MAHEQSALHRYVDHIWQSGYAKSQERFNSPDRASQDGSVAVYAAALQDVVNLFRDRPATVHGVAVDVAAMEAIADYAASVGLEVTL